MHHAESAVAIVDDDLSMRDALAGLLASVGLRAVTFASGQAYIESARSLDLKCLILDGQMPGMSGLDLLAWLAASGSAVPAILVTSALDEGTRLRALRAGAVAVLGKPFDESELLARIASAAGLRTCPRGC